MGLGKPAGRRYSGGMKRPPLLALALLSVTAAALASPPPAADPALAPWFHQLRRPGSGFPCCSEADCRNVEVRAAGNHMEVFIGREAFGSRAPNAWVVVPPSRVLVGLDNPTGGPIACWAAWGGVLVLRSRQWSMTWGMTWDMSAADAAAGAWGEEGGLGKGTRSRSEYHLTPCLSWLPE